ncbi:MAG: hypothetical protein JNM79_15295 [Burkholderiales bacterium]|nr:hypothetical protein [Burkholderiales bacterium]
MTSGAAFRKAMDEFDLDLAYGDGADSAKRMKGTSEPWSKVIRESGAVAQ